MDHFDRGQNRITHQRTELSGHRQQPAGLTQTLFTASHSHAVPALAQRVVLFHGPLSGDAHALLQVERRVRPRGGQQHDIARLLDARANLEVGMLTQQLRQASVLAEEARRRHHAEEALVGRQHHPALPAEDERVVRGLVVVHGRARLPHAAAQASAASLQSSHDRAE
eukprot:3866406-Prymnesium_polylepis.2